MPVFPSLSFLPKDRANIAYSDFGNEWISNDYRHDMAVSNDTEYESANASVTGVQIGITYRL